MVICVYPCYDSYPILLGDTMTDFYDMGYGHGHDGLKPAYDIELYLDGYKDGREESISNGDIVVYNDRMDDNEIDSPAYRQGHAEGFEGTTSKPIPVGEEDAYRHGHEDGDIAFHTGPPPPPDNV